MSNNDPATKERIAADEQNCDDCVALPDGWPCAECFITGGVPITAEGYDG